MGRGSGPPYLLLGGYKGVGGFMAIQLSVASWITKRRLNVLMKFSKFYEAMLMHTQ